MSVGGGHLLGYAHVSTAGQGPGAQLGALRWMGRVLTEHASGARRQRVLQQLLAWRHARRQRLDRLGRSILHLVDIARTLKQRDIGLCSLQESIDTTSAGGQLVFHIFGSLAEFESELIAAPVGAGTLTRGAGGKEFPPVRTRREGVGYDPREPPYGLTSFTVARTDRNLHDPFV